MGGSAGRAGKAGATSSAAVSQEGGAARKMSNKERYELANLEKEIDALSQRSKELDGLLAAAQAEGKP